MTTPTDTAGLRQYLRVAADFLRDEYDIQEVAQGNDLHIDDDQYIHVILPMLEALPAMLDEIDTLRARVEELEGDAREFLDAAQYDPHMDGTSTFKGWNQSQLRRAEARCRTTLQGTKP